MAIGKPSKEKVRAVVDAYAKLGGPGVCTWPMLNKATGLVASTLQNYINIYAPYYKIKVPKKKEKPLDIAIAHVAKEKEDRKKRDDAQKVKGLSKQVIALESEMEALLQIRKNVHTFKIAPSKSKYDSEATAFWLASDWHVEERVTLEQTNGINEYNPEISRSRGEAFFKKGLRLTNMLAQDVKIDNIVLALLGDFITGFLHSQNNETNYMPPVEATIYAQSIIHSGIKFLLENSKYNITVVCKSGNHGRTTKFSEFGSENGHSHEFFMYNTLRDIFKDEKRVTFVISEGAHTYLEVYGRQIRFLHGHDIKYGGGVGGITIPVNKAIAQWDRARPAYLTCFGHFHQLLDGGNFMANGSLIGYNAFALSIKASAEQPAQQLFLIDKKRGKTIVAPILFDI